jgi:hypothetical protein
LYKKPELSHDQEIDEVSEAHRVHGFAAAVGCCGGLGKGRIEVMTGELEARGVIVVEKTVEPMRPGQV